MCPLHTVMQIIIKNCSLKDEGWRRLGCLMYSSAVHLMAFLILVYCTSIIAEK